MLRLIINADDLGRDPGVNDAIADLLGRGLITSATVMANAPQAADAIRKIPPALRPALGVHLNITEFRPLTEHPGWQGWLDPQGGFSLAAFRTRPLTAGVREAILAEWSAQINRLRAWGLESSHLDSHHDVHLDFRLLGVLKRLQRRCGLRKVRLAPTWGPNPRHLHLRNRLWNLALRACPPFAVTTAGFMDFLTFLEAAGSGRHLPSTLEVMVHPGHPRFAQETGLLAGSWRERLPWPVTLISYRDL